MVVEMTEQKEEENPEEEIIEEKDIADILEQITPFVETLAPKIVEYQKVRAPQIKRYQYVNFIIMMSILLSVFLLTYCELIDGSAATGLLGAVIGYVFGNLYRREK